jgi:hypothetical protein
VIAERRQTSLLARTFFGRLFESDLMPPGLPQIQLVVWVIAFLGAPSTLAPILLSKKYLGFRDPAALHSTMAGDRTLALMLSMVATGLVTLVLWENVFPDRRDGRILGVLPIRLRTFVVARMAALLMLFGLLVAAMTLLSSISFGLVNLIFGGVGGFIGQALSHFAAAAGLEATVFFGIIALQCLLLNTFGAATAQRLAVALQILLVVGLLQMPLLLSLLRLPQVPSAAPLIGVATGAFAMLLYAGSYRRMTRLALEGTGVSTVRKPRLRALVPAIARIATLSAPARAVCAFTLRTALRSRQHRMLLAGWVGVACALVLSAVLPSILRGDWDVFARPRSAVLVAPLIFAALTTVGMRMVFAIPSEIRANWALRGREPIPVRQAVDGAAAALMACVLPAVLLALLSGWSLWGLKTGLFHAAYSGLLGVFLAQLLAIGVDKIPFTCTYVPGKAKFVKLWPLYLTLFSTYTLTMASLEAELLRRGGIMRALMVFAALSAIAAFIRYRRASELPCLRFDEEPEDTLTVLRVS